MTSDEGNIWGERYELWRKQYREMTRNAYDKMSIGEPLTEEEKQDMERVRWYLNTVTVVPQHSEGTVTNDTQDV